jgi:D-inositol-3-phosphate glycosyltransferase
MKLLFVLENYLPHIGGVEIVFKNLCEGLAKRGHQVTVLTRRLPWTKKEEMIAGVKVIRICSPHRYIFTFAAIPKAFKLAKKADIVHTTTFNAAPPAWLAAQYHSKPVIITVHETWIGKWRRYTNFSAPRAWLHELLERMVFLPRYDRYACVSNSTAKQLREALPDADIVTIHNGFDPNHWSKRRNTAALRKKLTLEGKFVILGYGRPGASKGFEYLVGAFSSIKRKLPNAVLLLILSNDKQYAHEIDRMKQDASAGTIFLDPQRYDDLPSYTQMADCIVVPSITEGFGYTTLESVASGTPVVASNTTSIPEVIYGKHILVQPRSSAAIAKAVLQVAEGKWKTTKPKNFTWSKAIDSYEREYRRLA